MDDDEKRIARGRSTLAPSLSVFSILALAFLSDTKWVVAWGLAQVVVLLFFIADRLHEICIRSRRMNVSLRALTERM